MERNCPRRTIRSQHSINSLMDSLQRALIPWRFHRLRPDTRHRKAAGSKIILKVIPRPLIREREALLTPRVRNAAGPTRKR